jgi:hypothetical protein
VGNTQKQNGRERERRKWIHLAKEEQRCRESVGQLSNRSLLLLHTDKCHCAVRQLLSAVTGYQSGAVGSDAVWLPKCLHIHGLSVTQHTAPPSLCLGPHSDAVQCDSQQTDRSRDLQGSCNVNRGNLLKGNTRAWLVATRAHRM